MSARTGDPRKTLVPKPTWQNQQNRLFCLIVYLSKPSDIFQISHACEQMLMLASFKCNKHQNLRHKIIPESSILRLTFQTKSALKFRIREIIIGFPFYIQSVSPLKLKL